jgi:hypothetical protein
MLQCTKVTKLRFPPRARNFLSPPAPRWRVFRITMMATGWAGLGGAYDAGHGMPQIAGDPENRETGRSLKPSVSEGLQRGRWYAGPLAAS